VKLGRDAVRDALEGSLPPQPAGYVMPQSLVTYMEKQHQCGQDFDTVDDDNEYTMGSDGTVEASNQTSSNQSSDVSMPVARAPRTAGHLGSSDDSPATSQLTAKGSHDWHTLVEVTLRRFVGSPSLVPISSDKCARIYYCKVTCKFPC
jgi:hypothetical protein